MNIVWDEPKRLANIDKHGLDFARLDFDFFMNSRIIPAQSGRYKAVGWLQRRKIIVVIFKPLGSEALSVISMRTASVQERTFVHDKI